MPVGSSLQGSAPGPHPQPYRHLPDGTILAVNGDDMVFLALPPAGESPPSGAVAVFAIATLQGAAAIDATVIIANGVTLDNPGTITGAAGVPLRDAATPGGLAVYVLSGGTLNNDGTVLGGVGSGGSATYNIGGDGGSGVAMQSTGYLNNAGTIEGGAGGGIAAADAGQAAIGGNGGAGVVLQPRYPIYNEGLIQGGAGGSVDQPGNGTAALAGAGGAGLSIVSSGSFGNYGTIVGGAGGYAEGNGLAGSAGTGVVMAAGTLSNSGAITGGAGGASYRDGQDGGIGVDLAGPSLLLNRGTITGGIPGEAGLENPSGSGGGAVLLGANGTVSNSGTIVGGAGVYSGGISNGGTGVALVAGGLVSNYGLIEGGLTGFSDFAFNTGSGGVGIDLVAGGTIDNDGTILGGPTPGYSIIPVDALAIYLQAGGTIDNDATGVIGSTPYSGGIWVQGGAGTITDAGTIDGPTAYPAGSYYAAIRFYGSFADRVILDPGAVINGAVLGGTGTNTLELVAGPVAGTLSGLATQFDRFDTVVVDAGASWVFNAADVIGAGVTVDNAGTLVSTVTVGSGGSLDNSGTIIGTPGMTIPAAGAPGSPGALVLSNGALTNSGLIAGGHGSNGSALSNIGGDGATGVILQSGAALANTGTIEGGAGGAIAHAYQGQGSVGGTGGTGILLLSGAATTNDGTVLGGAGGTSYSLIHSQSSTGGAGGVGVSIATTGTFTNDGTIIGGNGGDGDGYGGTEGGVGGSGVVMVGGTLTNAGVITAGSAGFSYHYPVNGGIGVDFRSAAILSNSGTITGGVAGSAGLENIDGSGGQGVLFERSGTLLNSGTIVGGASVLNGDESAGGNGVELDLDGLVTNSGLIEGGIGSFDGDSFGVGPGGAGIDFLGYGTITNSGTVLGGPAPNSYGAGGVGIYVSGGVLIDNEAGGLIGSARDGTAIVASGNETITDAGTIAGAAFRYEVGQYFNAIDFIGSYADRVILDAGAVLQGQVAGGLLTNTLELAATAPGVTGTVSGFGTEFTSFGTIVLDTGADWLLDGASPIGQAVTLSGGDVLSLNDTAGFANPIDGFSRTDALDLRDVTFAAGATATLAGTTLTVSSDGATNTLTLLGLSPDSEFAAIDDGTGHVLIEETVPCFVAGTRILTPRGEIPVEALQVGETVMTLSGTPRPIRWIGRRSYSGRFAAGNRDVLPVCIRADALADDVPQRDLWVSPLHAMHLDGVLVPAAALLNGLSIVQADAVEQVDYIHVELDSHDIVLAEGAAAETFVDDDSRGMFHNAREHAALFPDAVRIPARYCAPRIEQGALLEALRRRLLLRARSAAEPAAPGSRRPGLPGALLGHVDSVQHDRISGWARDPAQPDQAVHLRVLDDGVVLCEVTADRHRPDLEQLGFGGGRHGFDIAIPGGLSPLQRHVIEVQRASDWQLLDRPCVVEPAPLPAAPVAVAVNVPEGWHGRLDLATRERMRGWAQDGAEPEAGVALQVLDNGVPILRVVANSYRPDLRQAGIGSGRHGFEVSFPAGLSPAVRHVIQVRREADGAELANSPIVIEPADSFDATLQHQVARVIDGLLADTDRERVLSFLLEQADHLRQQSAEAQSVDAGSCRGAGQGRTPGSIAARPVGRVLVVDARMPVPSRDAGSRVILSHMQALQVLGYEVSFAAADHADDPASARAAQALQAMGVACLGMPVYGSVEEVLRRHAGRFDLIYLHRADMAARYMALSRRHMTRARVIYSVADLHHLRLHGQAVAQDRPELLAESRRLRMVELTAARNADIVLTHSTEEAALLRHLVPGARIHLVPWGVPASPGPACFDRRRGLAFIGGYAHAPNVDAALALVLDVMPLVWQSRPDVPCLLVGSDMPAQVRSLARPGIEVLGQVDDLADVLDVVRLTAAPLRFGAGVKGKVLDSLAASVPCAMSKVAAQGLALPPPLQACVAADAAELAAVILRLHDDAAIHAATAAAGLAFIGANHGEACVVAALGAAIRDHVLPAFVRAG